MVDVAHHDVEIFRCGQPVLWRRKQPWDGRYLSTRATVVLQRGNAVRIESGGALHTVQTSSLRVAS